MKRHEEVKERLKYSTFTYIVLNELLRAHYSFLAPVRREFKKVDELNIGFLDAKEFEELFDNLDRERTFERKSLIDVADPKHSGVLTFSSLVKAFAEKSNGKSSENVSLLQYFYDKEN